MAQLSHSLSQALNLSQQTYNFKQTIFVVANQKTKKHDTMVFLLEKLECFNAQ